jgi:DNA-binding XRE family transcriptional regulator
VRFRFDGTLRPPGTHGNHTPAVAYLQRLVVCFAGMVSNDEREIAEMFAALMSQHRRLAGLSYRGLASVTAVGHGHLWKIEKGLVVPSFPLAVKLGRVLGMDLAVLL